MVSLSALHIPFVIARRQILRHSAANVGNPPNLKESPCHHPAQPNVILQQETRWKESRRYRWIVRVSFHLFLADLGLALVLQRHSLSREVTSLSSRPPLKNYTMLSRVFKRDTQMVKLMDMWLVLRIRRSLWKC